MMLKECRCGRLIPQSVRLCKQCAEQEESRHMIYNETKRSKKAAAFYVSPQWRRLRPIIISVFDGIDIYALYVEHKIVSCNEVHHIEELEDNWSRRFDPLNLIPLSHDTHTHITSLYKESKESMKRTQKLLLSLIERHFKEAGGIEKVLSDLLVVAPPLFLGENSPRRISETLNDDMVSDSDTEGG